jgi:8-oxo-dGTP pyrophosphatase MutT (NUDIX family)
MAVTPKPSATIVLARDSDHGPEVLLVRRRAGDAFGKAYTFPGGVLDDDESAARDFCTGANDDTANTMFGIDEGGLDYFSAVVRELFEETGVLLTGGEVSEDSEAARQALCDGNLTWPDFLGRNSLTIECDQMHYIAHWITPTVLPKRWSTRFFLARMPDEQKVTPDGREVTDYCWLTPAAAATAARDGSRKLPFPTQRTVESLADVSSVDELLNWARQRQDQGIPAILPEVIGEGGKRRILMPDLGE